MAPHVKCHDAVPECRGRCHCHRKHEVVQLCDSNRLSRAVMCGETMISRSTSHKPCALHARRRTEDCRDVAPVLHSSRHSRPGEACVAAAVQAEEHGATCASREHPASTKSRLSMREVVSAISGYQVHPLLHHL